MPRFSMTFSKGNSFYPPQQKSNNLVQHLGTKRAAGGLNLPMIERVHRSKPGCSACGKKVM